MDNPLYITLSRQIALMKGFDVISNNMSNVNTNGFRSQKTLFAEYIANPSKKDKLSYVHDKATHINTTEGAMSITGRTYDVAINGQGFFVLNTPLGQRYTRAGNFKINDQGNISTMDGYEVLDRNNTPIFISPDIKKVQFGEDGTIYADGQQTQQINVVNFPNSAALEKAESGTMKSRIPPTQATGYKLAQGMLESSNVQPILELTDLINVQRTISTSSNLIQTLNQLETDAIKKLGENN